MAIQFARIEIVSRSSGGRACCKGAYNARTKIKDEQSNITYNFLKKGDNVYHAILLPEGVDKRFKIVQELMNEVERCEKRKDSQLLKEILIALPDDKELRLKDRIEIIHRIIEKREWVKNGLAVQIDIHQPHDGEKNWHAHLLVTTRRFKEDGLTFGAKAIDLNPAFKKAGSRAYIVPEDQQIHEDTKEIINDYFKELGLENRVDEISTVPHEHIGPIRMRSILNEAVERNELRTIAHLENMKDADSVLDRITRTQSVFHQKDLIRAVKDVPDSELRAHLVQEAISSKRIIPLYSDVDIAEESDQANTDKVFTSYNKSQYFTTTEVRTEEERILRIANRINIQPNISRSPSLTLAIKRLSENNIDSLSAVQKNAIEEILLGEGGVRVLRGRAGTGKSHVLGITNKLALREGQHVVGLAPTNKAKNELMKKGFKDTYTVKGFLFALNNGRVELPKGSLVVLDEAGMVGNSDMLELVKAVSNSKANLVLAGDEKQLTSVERGGLFEVMARKFGSYELSDIRRQSQSWGRVMANEFAKGNVVEGVSILQKQDKINAANTLEESMSALISKWQASKSSIDKRLIITVRNLEVDALNNGIREVLKANGTLHGEEYSITRKEKVGESFAEVKRDFMAGDRIMFAANNKELGVQNGEFGQIVKVSSEEFIVKLDRDGNKEDGHVLTFNPTNIEGLRHGYAVTTYKSQGSSIEDVYNLHSGIGNTRSTYVNLTRHIDDVSLFYNRENTRNIKHLTQQLSKIDDKSSSLNFMTESDIRNIQDNVNEQKTTLDKIGGWFKDKIVAVGDRLHTNPGYYKFEAPVMTRAKVEEALAKTYEHIAENEIGQNYIEQFKKEQNVELREDINNTISSMGIKAQMQVIEGKAESYNQTYNEQQVAANGGSSIKSNGRVVSSKTAKERFYEKADRVLGSKVNNNDSRDSNNSAKHEQTKYKEIIDYKGELTSLKSEIRFKAEKITLNLLGEPNKRLSNGNTYRYGEKGSLAVSINGSRAGTWYDFEAGIGGDIISLVERETKRDFKESVEYLKELIGLARQTSLRLVHDNEARERYAKSVEADTKETARLVNQETKISNLFSKSKEISESSIASKYLQEERNIKSSVDTDIRATEVWDKSTAKHYPAIVAFVRDNSGKITGGQTILLDPHTAQKASVDIPKKSFGKIVGSFVQVQSDITSINTHHPKITFIAEGLETALSVKEAGLEGQILCSLGISNIKHYQPQEGERVLLCADNDGIHAKTIDVINKARELLEERGAIVNIVTPKEKGDFNDVLKVHGIDAVKEELGPAINHLKEDNGFSRVREKIGLLLDKEKQQLSLSTETRTYINNNSSKVNIDLTIKEISAFEHELDIMGKYASNDGYGVMKTYKEYGLLAANKVAYELNGIAIDKKITEALNRYEVEGSANPSRNENILCDFKGVIYGNKIDYLLAISEDKEVMRYLATSPVKEQIDEALRVKEEIKYETEMRNTYANELINNSISRIEEIEHWSNKKLDHAKLINTLSQMKGKEQVKYLKDMRDSTMESALTMHLSEFGKDKKNANTMDQLKPIIMKEQEFLMDIYKNRKDEDFMYSFNISKIMHAGRSAINYPKRIDQVYEIAKDLVDNKIISEHKVLSDIRDHISTDYMLNEIRTYKEYHDTHKVLPKLTAEKIKSETLEEILKASGKEQEFLANLHGNLHQYRFDKELLSSTQSAYDNRNNNVMKDLHKVIKRCQVEDIKEEKDIITILQKNNNIYHVFSELDRLCQEHDINMDKNLEKHTINDNLSSFDKQIIEAKKIPDIIKAATIKQEYLADLYGNLRHHDHDEKLMKKIEAAYNVQNSEKTNNLEQLVNHSLQNNIISEKDLIEKMKERDNLHHIHKTVDMVCQQHHLDFVTKNINQLIRNEPLKMYGQEFKCPIKYLEHEITHPAYIHTNVDHLNKMMPNLEQHMDNLEKTKHLELEHRISGPNF